MAKAAAPTRKKPVRKAAKKTAAKAAVEADGLEARPTSEQAAEGYQTPEARQARTIEVSLVESAMRKAGASGKPSGRNLCWVRIPAGVQREIAVAHIVDRVAADALFTARAAEMAGWEVSRSSYDRWTRDLRKAFETEYARHRKGRATIDHAIWNTGDLVANLGVWFGQIAPLMTSYATERLQDDPSKDEMGCILRFTECAIDAAKVQAEAKLTERKTLLLALKACNEKGLNARSAKVKEQAIRDSVELVNAIIRGEVAA